MAIIAYFLRFQANLRLRLGYPLTCRPSAVLSLQAGLPAATVYTDTEKDSATMLRESNVTWLAVQFKDSSVLPLRPWKQQAYLGRGAHVFHLDFHTAPELCSKDDVSHYSSRAGLVWTHPWFQWEDQRWGRWKHSRSPDVWQQRWCFSWHSSSCSGRYVSTTMISATIHSSDRQTWHRNTRDKAHRQKLWQWPDTVLTDLVVCTPAHHALNTVTLTLAPHLTQTCTSFHSVYTNADMHIVSLSLHKCRHARSFPSTVQACRLRLSLTNGCTAQISSQIALHTAYFKLRFRNWPNTSR